MYKEHHFFISPSNPNIKIWRYMNIDKFLDLITSENLFFASADKLGDSMEGSYTKNDLLFLQEMNIKIREAMSYHAKEGLSFYKINSWHMSKEENLSMWKSYTEKGKGIVIQSTFDRLTRSFSQTKEDIFIGKVQYIDHRGYDFRSIGMDPLRFFYKDVSFSYENELRAMKFVFKIKKGRYLKALVEESLVKVDINILIETILVSPFMDERIYKAVKEVVKKFYPLLNVKISSLKKRPIFSFSDI